MSGQTIIEKIISSHNISSKPVKANDIVICNFDLVLAQDGTAPLGIKEFNKLNNREVRCKEKVFLFIDHNSPPPNEGVANLHKLMREFAKTHNIKLYDIGEGICHQLMIESKRLYPGSLVIGADSHTITYGAMNLAALGIGSTDFACALSTSKIWLKVPQTIKITLSGKTKPYVFSKDVALYLLRELKEDFANYKCIEYDGEYINSLSLEERFTLTNLSAELGAKAAIMPYDKILKVFFEEFYKKDIKSGIFADEDAQYEKVLKFEVDDISPQVALPHSPSNCVDIDKVLGLKVDLVVIGTCTNGRLSDLTIAHKILKNRKVKTRLLIIPASINILKTCLERGIIQDFISAGAVVLPPGCGPCVGTHAGIPADGEVVVSTSNRNFKGRMGNDKAFIYIASPATAAASAITAKITHPAEFIPEFK